MSALYDRIGRIIAARPNWSNPVTVEFQFKTNVLVARDGAEQRESMRQTARVALTYGTILDRAAMRRHMADLAEGQHLPFAVPSEWRRATLTVATVGGETVISLDGTPFWMVAGADLVVSDGSIAELVTVASVGVGSVTLVSPITTAFGSGADVFHAYSARVPDSANFRAVTDRTRTTTLRLDVDPVSDPQPLMPATPATFEGRELFLVRPNWRDEPQVTYSQDREVVDSDVGLIEVGTPRVDHTLVLQLGFTRITADDAESLIAIFLRMKGRRGSFWMPTWQQDIAPRVTAIAASSSLEVEGSDFLAAYGTSQVYNVLMVLWPDGSYQVNRVASLALDVSLNTVLTMTDPWAFDVDAAAQVMWCPLWRFASDVLEVEWQTTRVAEMTMAMQTLSNEAP